MPRHGRRSPLLGAALLVAAALACVTISFHASHLFVPHAVGPVIGARRLRLRRPSVTLLRAEADDGRSSALVRLEQDIEGKMQVASEANDAKRVTELARLLVLAKASEGAAAWQSTAELRETVASSIAATLTEFVSKNNYDIADVAAVVDKNVGAAVSSLDNVYLTAEAAAFAPPGSNPIILSDVMTPVVAEMAEGAKEAVAGFTGKEKYEFGDISKEADKRAKQAIATLLGKDEYQFGDLSKAAAARAMDAVTSITGKKDYQFGDLTKTFLRNALNFLEGDDEKKDSR